MLSKDRVDGGDVIEELSGLDDAMSNPCVRDDSAEKCECVRDDADRKLVAREPDAGRFFEDVDAVDLGLTFLRLSGSWSNIVLTIV